VRRELADGGWPAIDALYRDPPDGTHALLHAAPSPSSALPAPELPAELKLTSTDVLGEQSWRTLLESWLPLDVAAELASAWSGDRLSSFEGAGERVLVWEIRSDVLHATEAARATRRGLRLPLAPESHAATDFACRTHRDTGALGQWGHGPSLFLVWLVTAAATTRCDTLLAWARAPAAPVSGGSDPGPRRLIGPSRPNPAGNAFAPR
jgi:hypothetical protein